MRRKRKRYKDKRGRQRGEGAEVGAVGSLHTHPVQTVPHNTARLRAGREKGWDGSVTGCGSKISVRD